MSEASAGRLSMRKPAAKSGTPGPETPGSTTPPMTVNLIGAGLALMVLCNIVSALLLLGSTDALKRFEIHNFTTSSSNTPIDAVHAVYQLRQGALIQAVLFLVMLSLLGYAMRKPRSASATRWALLIIFIVTGLPYQVYPTSGLPVPIQIASVIDGVTAIAVIFLIFVPAQSRDYYRACRQASMPPEMRGQPRPGLSSLFGPRRTAGTAGARTAGPRGTRAAQATRSTQPAQTRPADTRPAAGKARAKVRSDSDAVSKGAELARSRAKASKSRRSG